MLEYLIYFIFIITVAFAAGGVVLSNRLRSVHKHDFLSYLLYYQVFIYTFGFYGLWGQVIISVFMRNYLSPESLVRLSEITILPGLPFLVFAWMMLLRFSSLISGRKAGNRFVVWFLFINLALIIIMGYLIAKFPALRAITLIKYYFISFNALYWISSSVIIAFPAKEKAGMIAINRLLISITVLCIMLLQNTILFFYSSQTIIAALFIFSFFAGNLFLPLFMSYGAKYILPEKTEVQNPDIDTFCNRYEISPREKEIIVAICKGLSNKEIADSLFISLQTVKDHSHRIYIKTNVKSRVNLINLVREMTSLIPERETTYKL